MQNHSTIAVPDELKENLEKEKQPYETWPAFLYSQILAEGEER
jgi:hypothetical protein